MITTSAPHANFALQSSHSEARAFYQERLALFGQICTLLTLGYFVTFNAFSLFTDTPASVLTLDNPVNAITVAGLGIFGTIWWLCRCRTCHVPALHSLDFVSAMAFSGVFAYYGWSTGVAFELQLPLAFILILRVVTIPSSVLRTTVISTIVLLPMVLVYALLSRKPELASEFDSLTTINFTIRCLMIVAITATTSWVIFGLRQEVRAAQKLGQYTLEEKIGEGGIGEVYRAAHAMLRRPTAVKLLRPEKTGRDDLARFEREVQLTSRLTHPNTISIYDYGRTPEGTFYYAMELLEGLNLDQLVEQYGPQEPARVIHVLRQVCGSLAEAHDIGLIHRDIKPTNILLCERGGTKDVAKVIDFGLVKSLDTGADVAVTEANTITGTPLYLSPEAIRSPHEVDGRSDLYALGGVGYYLLTGRHVFEAENPFEVISMHLTKAAPPPSERAGFAVPSDLENVLLSCLEKDRAHRPACARVLSEALRRCRDAASWNPPDIEAWWKAHEQSVSAASAASSPELPTPSGLPTVTVDLRQRDKGL